VTFSYNDTHVEGKKVNKTMSAETFKDMTNSVMMIKNK
jgi:hypothetical protein